MDVDDSCYNGNKHSGSSHLSVWTFEPTLNAGIVRLRFEGPGESRPFLFASQNTL